MQLPKSDQLNIASLSRLFDNKSECYKLFWFQAILTYVCKGESEIRFEDLINEMIADAWYMVTEYHLNLGPRDTLEKVVNYISENTGMLPAEKKQVILNWLKACQDSTVNKYKRDLTLNVDYSGPPAHPGRSSAQPDRASAHLIRSAVQPMPTADQRTC